MLRLIATVLDWTPRVFETLLAVSLFILAPLAILRRTRRLAAIGFLLAAPCFAIITWISCAAIVFATWGLGALILSILCAGVGTVLAGIVATLMRGDGYEIASLLTMIAATVGAGIAGMKLDDPSLKNSDRA